MKKLIASILASVLAAAAFAQPTVPINNARFGGTNNVLSGATFNTLSGASSIIAAGGTLTNANLTSGRVVFSSTGGLQADSASLTFNSGTGALSATTFVGALTGHASLDLALTGGTLTGNLLFTDATYDIGASGLTRPRNGFFSGTLTAGNHVGTFAGNTFTTGTGTLTIAASKTLTASDNVTLASDGTGTRTLNIAAGGTLGSNAFTSTGYLPLAGGTMVGNLLFTDNTYDIGASGATRPRTGYFGTSVVTPIINSSGTLIFGTNGSTAALTLGTDQSATFAGVIRPKESALGISGASATTSGFYFTTSGQIRYYNAGIDIHEFTGSGSTILSGVYDLNLASMATTSTDGILIESQTAATGGVTVRYSPRTRYRGFAWDTAASQTLDWMIENRPTSAATPSSTLTFLHSLNGAAATTPMTLTSGGALTTAGGITATGQLIGAGTATNNNAAAGVIGEYVSSLVAIGSPQSLTTNTTANVTSISLTAGDWDVVFLASVTETTSTVTARVAGISSTSATLPTDGSEGYNGTQSVVTSETNSIPVARTRFSLSGTTTIYAVEKVTFSAGTAGGFGSLNARRAR